MEPIEIQSDALCLTMRPDCKELAVLTLDGHVTIFDIEDAKQLHLIDGRKDIVNGRYWKTNLLPRIQTGNISVPLLIPLMD